MSVRIGVIGCGTISWRAHLPGFSPAGSKEAVLAARPYLFGGCENSKIVAVADIDLDKAKKAAKVFNVAEVHSDWRKITSSKNIDAVSICVPNYLHAEIAIEAIKNGKHVLVEKPIAITVEDADRMIEAAKSANVLLMAEQTMRFSPINEIAKEYVQNGHLGKIHSVRTRQSHPGPQLWSSESTWFKDKSKAGAGTVIDLGIHNIDLVRWLVGDEISEVSAYVSFGKKYEGEIEENAVSVFKFRNGTLGVGEMSWTTDPAELSTTLYGEKGNLRIGSGDIPLYIEYPPKNNLSFNYDLPVGSIKNTMYIPAIPPRGTLGGPFRHFVDCIANGKQPLAGGKEARNSLAVICAILESAKTGKSVKLD